MEDKKVFYCVSDIHSFYKELKEALNKAGYDSRNKDHILIVCGDIFDRGPDAIKVHRFLKRIPKKRRILIKGNHEQLYLELLNKEYPGGHDFHNYTVDTFCQIAGQKYINNDGYNTETHEYLDSYSYVLSKEDLELEYQEKHSLWEDIRNKVADSEVTKWLQSDEWKDYYELDKYIFVHSFIPNDSKHTLSDSTLTTIDINWREANKKVWDDARWGCPWEKYSQGLFDKEKEKGKVLVCGHWHTADFFLYLKGIKQYDRAVAPIYYSKNLIGLDGGCAYNYYTDSFYHPQNVLIIKNNKCYDKYDQLLKEPKSCWKKEKEDNE